MLWEHFCYTRDYMESKKRSLLAGALLFIGITAVVLVVVNLVRLFTAMPTKSEVINFASEMTNSATDASIEAVGSLVPDSNVPTKATDDTTMVPATTPTVEADWLSPEQRRTLSKLGIDESRLPSTLTPELEACFVKAIGEERVQAIKAGDSPTVVEGMKAVTCL